MLKVLVVDDSSFIRKVVREMLSFDKEIEIVGEAADGRETIEKVRELKPDVICLDIIMPMPDGLWTLEEINKQYPTPVVIFSSISGPTAEITAEAFRLGVIDVVQKPGQFQNIHSVRQELIDKLKSAAKIDHAKLRQVCGSFRVSPQGLAERPRMARTVIAIGSSAGGPPALYEMLSRIPMDIQAGIVVAQHIPPYFVDAFAGHLKKYVSFSVKVAEDGDIVSVGRILISPSEKTARVKRIKHGGVIHLEKIECRTRPCINALFESVALSYGKNALGVVLSGMGDDGTAGLKAIKEAGGKTFAQDEKTSLVWGMPQAAQKAGVTDFVLPADKIAEELVKAVQGI